MMAIPKPWVPKNGEAYILLSEHHALLSRIRAAVEVERAADDHYAQLNVDVALCEAADEDLIRAADCRALARSALDTLLSGEGGQL